VFCDFSTFSRTLVFFLLPFSSLPLPTSCFICRYCRQFDY
jgi:hypothetical protein